MARKFVGVSDAEMAVLRILWAHGPATVREAGVRLKPGKRCWAYTTIQTLLNRLEAKGYVASDKSGPAHVFRAIVTRDNLLFHRLRELADDLCDGTTTPLVKALVQRQRFTAEELDEFRRLIDEIDRGKK